MPGGVGQMMPPVQYVPVEGDNGPGGVPGAPGGPPGPAFFMPHMYMDQNGQPVYYRMPNPNAGPYQQQEMMYAGGPEGGSSKKTKILLPIVLLISLTLIMLNSSFLIFSHFHLFILYFCMDGMNNNNGTGE